MDVIVDVAERLAYTAFKLPPAPLLSEFPRQGVLAFGGRSGEHEVSLRSAESVLQSLDPQKYEVVPIAITHEGRWLSSGNNGTPPGPGGALLACDSYDATL